MNLHFVETPIFSRRIIRELTLDDYFELQVTVHKHVCCTTFRFIVNPFDFAFPMRRANQQSSHTRCISTGDGDSNSIHAPFAGW